MVISSLVITLEHSERLGQARETLAKAGPFFVGQAFREKLPVVLETPDGRSARDWFDWLLGLPGVRKVDLVFASFDRETDQAAKEVPDAR